MSIGPSTALSWAWAAKGGLAFPVETSGWLILDPLTLEWILSVVSGCWKRWQYPKKKSKHYDFFCMGQPPFCNCSPHQCWSFAAAWERSMLLDVCRPEQWQISRPLWTERNGGFKLFHESIWYNFGLVLMFKQMDHAKKYKRIQKT